MVPFLVRQRSEAYQHRGGGSILSTVCAFDHRLWSYVCISSVGELKYFVRRTECSPGALQRIKVLSVNLLWEWYSDYHYDWQVCGPPEAWYFADRTLKKREYLLKNVIPEDERSADEADWDEIYDCKYVYGWNRGYDGDGEDSLVAGVEDFRRLLTPLVEAMKNLQKFHWGTNVIPLNSRIASALSRAEHLQEVSLGPCGQFYTSSKSTDPGKTRRICSLSHLCTGFSQSPLWLIFEGRGDRPLSCLYLNLEVLPSSRQFRDAEEALGQPPDKSMAALVDCYRGDKGIIKIPDPARYLRYTYQDEAVEPELNFVERPLAMLYRTLMASRGRLRHVQTTELALARVQDLLPIWAQTALKGMDNLQKPQDFRDDKYLQALADLQPALASLMTACSTLPSEDSFARLFQSRESLRPLLPCIQGNRELQARLWEAYLEGRRASLPDWTKPSLPDDPKLLQYFDMNGEHYIRDLPKD